MKHATKRYRHWLPTDGVLDGWGEVGSIKLCYYRFGDNELFKYEL